MTRNYTETSKEEISEVLGNNSERLQTFLEMYSKAVAAVENWRSYASTELLKPEAPQYLMNILDNPGLTLEEKYDILKGFVKE